MYTVREAAAKAGLTAHAVRYYCDMDMVPSLTRDSNNNRQFDEKSVNWLAGIKRLRGAGMSVASIKQYIDLCLEGESSIPKRYEILLEQKRIIDEQLKEAALHADYLSKKLERFEKIMNKDIIDTMNPDNWMT